MCLAMSLARLEGSSGRAHDRDRPSASDATSACRSSQAEGWPAARRPRSSCHSGPSLLHCAIRRSRSCSCCAEYGPVLVHAIDEAALGGSEGLGDVHGIDNGAGEAGAKAQTRVDDCAHRGGCIDHYGNAVTALDLLVPLKVNGVAEGGIWAPLRRSARDTSPAISARRPGPRTNPAG